MSTGSLGTLGTANTRPLALMALVRPHAGIGYHLAEQFKAAGCEVWASARNPKSMGTLGAQVQLAATVCGSQKCSVYWGMHMPAGHAYASLCTDQTVDFWRCTAPPRPSSWMRAVCAVFVEVTRVCRRVYTQTLTELLLGIYMCAGHQDPTAGRVQLKEHQAGRGKCDEAGGQVCDVCVCVRL